MVGEGGAAELFGGDDERAAQVAAARERFVRLARRPDREIDLAEAALLIAAEEYPGLDVGVYLSRLDALAQRVRGRLAAKSVEPESPEADEASLAALSEVLFDEEGFRGAEPDDFYSPRHSFVNEVIEHKRGLPITLSVIYCEVARRAGLHAVGINLPGRFIVQFRGKHLSVYVNPFDRGTRLPDERDALAERVFGQRVELSPDHLRPASRKQILARMLGNLLGNYLRQRPPNLSKALAAVERMLAIYPSAEQVRDRGLILRAMGHQTINQAPAIAEQNQLAAVRLLEHAAQLLGSAWFDLKLYARLGEGTTDATSTGGTADEIWQLLARQN
ncbi:MAG: hypothetical protein HY332_05345 [Chloroflexi bacterium]|nr:hypothetical protein [Chloroflexota bacterium]